MATDLYIISDVKTTEKEVLKKKDSYLQKLKDLNLEHTSLITADSSFLKSEGDWEYEFPELYDTKSSLLFDNGIGEIISFFSPFVFNITVYPNCIVLSTTYKYRFLYEDEKPDFFQKFRKDVFDIINIFGGAEIIYLADNGCDKLGTYLETKIWEGVSYNEVKKNMIASNLPFVSDYKKLKLKDLSYGNITEVVFDNFKDLKKIKML